MPRGGAALKAFVFSGHFSALDVLTEGNSDLSQSCAPASEHTGTASCSGATWFFKNGKSQLSKANDLFETFLLAVDSLWEKNIIYTYAWHFASEFRQFLHLRWFLGTGQYQLERGGEKYLPAPCDLNIGSRDLEPHVMQWQIVLSLASGLFAEVISSFPPLNRTNPECVSYRRMGYPVCSWGSASQLSYPLL